MTLEHIRATLEYILNTMGDETVHQLIDYIVDVLEIGGKLTAKEIRSRLHKGYHANDVEQTLADMGKARLVEKVGNKYQLINSDQVVKFLSKKNSQTLEEIVSTVIEG